MIVVVSVDVDDVDDAYDDDNEPTARRRGRLTRGVDSILGVDDTFDDGGDSCSMSLVDSRDGAALGVRRRFSPPVRGNWDEIDVEPTLVVLIEVANDGTVIIDEVECVASVKPLFSSASRLRRAPRAINEGVVLPVDDANSALGICDTIDADGDGDTADTSSGVLILVG